MGAPNIEALADAILKASGSALRYYSMAPVRGAIFAAVEAAVDAGRKDAASGDLYDALKRLFDDFKELADSGDSGFWPLEETGSGKQALAALAKAEGRS